jgi:site-specific DNA-methyltransferase (cytosine-N4-specific)
MKFFYLLEYMSNTFYKTKFGKMLFGDSTEIIRDELSKTYKNKIQLIITSPPFPLNAKKKYGNLQGEEYKKWFASLAPLYSNLLTEDGSIVIEIGNSWEPNRPVQSTLHLESLLAFMKEANLNLIQEFVCYNPSRLPSPANWVTVNRIRTVDSYTHVWWLSKSDFPKADNRKVLRPYSKGMENLIKRQSYNTGKRPSGHSIGKKSFLTDNGGGIAHNLLEFEPIEELRLNRLPYNISEFVNLEDTSNLPSNVLSISNTKSNDYYSSKCRELGIIRHPATMQPGLIAFFVQFLTDVNDFVLDPFGGSNTTGYIAEKLDRNWICIEVLKEYIEQSILRFEEPNLEANLQVLYK